MMQIDCQIERGRDIKEASVVKKQTWWWIFENGQLIKSFTTRIIVNVEPI